MAKTAQNIVSDFCALSKWQTTFMHIVDLLTPDRAANSAGPAISQTNAMCSAGVDQMTSRYLSGSESAESVAKDYCDVYAVRNQSVCTRDVEEYLKSLKK